MLSYFLNNYIPPIHQIKTAGWSEGEYKGYKWRIEEDKEDDNVKLWHFVIKPNGEEVIADLSPYDGSRQHLFDWIDKKLILPEQQNKKFFEETFGT